MLKGITLHEKIECALDQGNIAILPVPDSHDTWKCVLVNEDMRNLPYLVAMSQAFRWGVSYQSYLALWDFRLIH